MPTRTTAEITLELPDDIRQALSTAALPAESTTRATLLRAATGYLEQQPGHPALNGLAGRLRLALGDTDGALEALARAEDGPSVAAARLHACVVSGAVAACADEADQGPPSTADPARHGAWSLLQAASGRAKRGAVHAGEMLEQFPGSLPLTIAAAWTALAADEPGRALLLAEMALAAEPPPAGWPLARAQIVRARATLAIAPGEAAASLRAGAQHDPDIARAWVEYLAARGRPEEALEAARAARDRFPASEALAEGTRDAEVFARRCAAALASDEHAEPAAAVDLDEEEAP